MYDFMCEDFDVEEIRRRYRAMTDEELLRSGRAAARSAQDQGTPLPRDGRSGTSTCVRRAPSGGDVIRKNRANAYTGKGRCYFKCSVPK